MPFIFLTILLLTIFFIDRSVQKGLFLDGLIYGSIARDMAMGKGSFWQPYYGQNLFWSHPPLMFGLEAIFFKIFGSFYGTEKIYSFFIWLVTVVLISRCWKSIFLHPEPRAFFWLPLVLWGFMPSVLWSYPNNILDSTMAVFDLAAVIVLYHGMRKNRNALYLLAGGLLIFCATLTKGVQGLFPVLLPLLYWLVYKQGRFAKAAVHTGLLMLITVLCYTILWQFHQPARYFEQYLYQQLWQSLSGFTDVTGSALGRFVLLEMLLTEMLIIAAVGVLVFVLSRLFKTGSQKAEKQKQHMLMFLFIGLAASLPMMVSEKLRSFYLIPSLPYFAIAGGVVIYPWLAPLTGRFTLGKKATGALNIGFVAAAITASVLLYQKAGSIGRDHEIINDVETISQVLPPNTRISVEKPLKDEYSLLAYLQRYAAIDAYAPLNLPKTRYLLMERNSKDKILLWQLYAYNYKLVDIPIEKYMLYKKAGL